MKTFGYGILTGMILSALVVLYGRNHFVKKEYTPEVKIVKEFISDTKWKDRYLKLKLEKSKVEGNKVTLTKETFDNLVYCVGSDIRSSTIIKDNTLVVHVEDDCKEADIKIDLKVIPKRKHFIQGGYSFLYGQRPIAKIGYIYNFKYFGVGGGINFSKETLGIEGMIQIPLPL